MELALQNFDDGRTLQKRSGCHYRLGSATHLSNKRWVMERWVFPKDGKDGNDGKDGFQRWERWVFKRWERWVSNDSKMGKMGFNLNNKNSTKIIIIMIRELFMIGEKYLEKKSRKAKILIFRNFKKNIDSRMKMFGQNPSFPSFGPIFPIFLKTHLSHLSKLKMGSGKMGRPKKTHLSHLSSTHLSHLTHL